MAFVVGPGQVNSVAVANVSISHTAGVGDDVFLDIVIDRTGVAPTTVKHGATTMTLLPGYPLHAGSSTLGVIYRYRAAGAGTGSAVSVTASIGASWWIANTWSCPNVSSVGSVLSTIGISTAPSTGPVTVGDNQIAVAAIFDATPYATGTIGSPTGGTNAYAGNNPTSTGSGGSCGLAISTATATDTFAATLSASTGWGTATNVITIRPDVTPGAAAITTTGGTPEVEQVGGLQPGGATISTTGSEPFVTAPKVVIPGGAAISATGGTPSSVQGPLNDSISKLDAGQDSVWQIVGDSTTYGQYDANWATQFGWVGRLAIAIGKAYDANVVVRPINYPSTVAYNAPVTVFTAVRGGLAPTLTVYLGGWPGAINNTYLSYITAWFPVSNPDVVIIQSGFNEANTSTFTSTYLTLINSIKNTYCPGAPIIVTTANATTATAEAGGKPPFASLWAAMTTAFLPGKTLPLSPPLQPSTAVGGVWVLDTQQAGLTSADLNNDGSGVVPANTGLHPNASGYAKQAAWMLAILAPAQPTSTLEQPGGATITTTGGTPTITRTGVVSPGGASVTGTGGTPTVTAPKAVTPGEASASLSGRVPLVDAGSGPWVPAPLSRTLEVPVDDRTLEVPVGT